MNKVLFNQKQEVTDIAFRDVNTAVKMKATVPTTYDQIIGEVRLAPLDQQPKEVGFGFVIHAPGIALKDFDQEDLQLFAAKGMRVEQKQPLFFKTERIYHRYTFKRGDVETANTVFGLLKQKSKNVFKNWI